MFTLGPQALPLTGVFWYRSKAFAAPATEARVSERAKMEYSFAAGLLVLIAVICIAIAVVHWMARTAEVRRIVQTPTSTIAGAADRQLVEIYGRVEASEQGTIRCPTTGVDVVQFHITTYAVDCDGDTTSTHVEKDSVEMLLRDGSGQVARIFPRGSEMLSRNTRYGDYHDNVAVRLGVKDPDKQLPLTEPIERWGQWVSGSPCTMVCETTIAPGDHLYVLGLAERQADGSLWLRAHDEEGATQPTLRTANLSVGAMAEHALFISNYSEGELLAVLRKEQRKAAVLGAVGLLIIVAAVAIGVIGPRWDELFGALSLSSGA